MKIATNQLHIVMVAALVAGGIWFAHAWQDRDARRINRRLNELRELLEKDGTVHQLRALAQSREVTRFFTTDAEIDLHPLTSGRITRRDLPAIHHLVHTRVDQLTIQISDRQLTIDGDQAQQQFTARGRVTVDGSRESRIYTFALHWSKIDGDWSITQARIQDTIRSPAAVEE